MPKPEANKYREWERERRDRLKTSFTALSRHLPCYDPSIVLSKLEILQRASAYIEELQHKHKDLLLGNNLSNKVEQEEIKKLHERVKKLTVRNEQLTNLLSNAGIKLPHERGNVEKFNKSRQWTNRISAEKIELLYKKIKSRQNETEKRSKLSSPKKNIVQSQANKKNATKKSISNTKKGKVKKIPKENIVIKSQRKNCINVSVTQQSTTTVLTQNCPLGPGTLILANGNIVPVLPPVPQIQTTILTAPTQIMLRQPQPVPVILMPQKRLCNNIAPMIKQKIGITKTTTVNKVPIPSLSSRPQRINRNIIKTKPRPAKPTCKNNEPKTIETPKETTNKIKQVQVSTSKAKDKIEEVPVKPVATSANYTIDSICSRAKKNTRTEPVVTSSQNNHCVQESVCVPTQPLLETNKKQSMTSEKNENNVCPVVTTTADVTHSDLSNDIFASLQVPSTGGQNPESISPTAAFLLAFPLVSSLTGGKVNDVMVEENSESHQDSPTLLQIGNIDGGVKNAQPETLPQNLLSLDNFTNLFSKENMTDCLHQNKRHKEHTKPPVNWMTGPDVRTQSDFVLPSFGKEFDFNATNELRYDSAPNDENNFTWSPTKLPSTLPTLIGDLALGTTNTSTPQNKCTSRNNLNTYDGQSSFLSVSQLMDRSADNRHNKNKTVAKTPCRNPPSNYSAEALISNNDTSRQYQSFHYPQPPKSLAPMPPFAPDSVMSYFPSIELSTSQDVAVSITDTPVYTSSFLSDLTADLNTDGTLSYTRNLSDRRKSNSSGVKRHQHHQQASGHRRPANADLNFLSLPSNLNSTMLSEDYHSGYLTNPSIYGNTASQMGTSLLPPLTTVNSRNGSIPHTVISPTIPPAATSLTNFNLSTIFPEMNKPPPTFPNLPFDGKSSFPLSFSSNT